MAHNGGLLGVNLDFALPYNTYWALNASKMQLNPWSTNNSSSTDWCSLIGADGLPTAMPAGVGAYWRGTQLWIYGNPGDTWDLYYPTTKTMALISGSNATLTESTIAAGWKRYTIGGTPPWSGFGGNRTNNGVIICELRITAMANNDWSTQEVILCQKVVGGVDIGAKALIDSGEIFHPVFLSHLGYGDGKTPYGLIRVMNWSGAFTFSPKFFPKQMTDYSYMGVLNDSRYFAGTATKTLNSYVTGTRFPGNPASWVNGQVVQFYMATRPSKITITSTTMGAVTTCTSVGHGLVTNDRVELNGDAAPGGQLYASLIAKDAYGRIETFPVTRIDNDTFTLPINSTGFSAVSSFDLLPMLTVGDGTLAQKRWIRRDFLSSFYSSWTGWTGGVTSGIYNSEFDCVIQTEPGLMPYELFCELANKIGAHLWVPLPSALEGAEERAAITIINNNLDTGLLRIFEKGNEPWNFSFPLYFYAENLFYVRHGVASPGQGYGLLSSNMCDNVATVIGSSHDYITLMDLQNASDFSTGFGLAALTMPTISAGNAALYPANKHDVVATAPYARTNFQGEAAANTYPGWVNAITDWKNGYIHEGFEWYAQEHLAGNSTLLGTKEPLSTHLSSYIPAHISSLASYTGRQGTGVEFWTYEVNSHDRGPDSVDGGFPSGGVEVSELQDFFFDFRTSYEWAHAAGVMQKKMTNAGVRWMTWFTAAGVFDVANVWGVWKTNDVLAEAPPAWNALQELNNGYFLFRVNNIDSAPSGYTRLRLGVLS